MSASPPAPPKNTFDFSAAAGDGLFIGISGLIGAGKTTLATALAEELNLPVYYEPVTDNVYLADFYNDIAKYAFPMQVYLLNKRFKQQQQIIWEGRGGVQDRTIYEDSVFARMLADSGLLSARDYQTYKDLFADMSNFMRRPNLIVHLDLTPEESMRRIKMRNRDCESGISLEYLTGLYEAYNSFITEIAKIIPVIKVDYSTFRTAKEMATAIKKEYESIANIRNVTFDKPLTPVSSPLKCKPISTPTTTMKSKPSASKTLLLDLENNVDNSNKNGDDEVHNLTNALGALVA